MAEPKMCATPGCGNPAAYRTRSKPAYCAECIERIASDAGLALEEPVVKPNDFIMTTCKRCGGRAHYRFNYILDKRGIGEPVCRRCYWESWYRGSWEQFGVGVAVVVFDEGLYRDPSLLRAEHAASFLSRFGPRFPPQSLLYLNRSVAGICNVFEKPPIPVSISSFTYCIPAVLHIRLL